MRPFASGLFRSLSPEVRPIVVEHAMRGIWLQVWLRGALVVFVLFTLGLVPPSTGGATCWVIAILYALIAAGVAVWIRQVVLTGSRADGRATRTRSA